MRYLTSHGGVAADSSECMYRKPRVSSHDESRE